MGDHPVGNRWGAHLEVQWRRSGILEPQQLLLRPAVNFRINPSLELSSGYAYIATSRYGEVPAPNPFPEHRLHQQFIIQDRVGKATLLHRTRLEERWIAVRTRLPDGSLRTEDWRYQNRLRYLLRGVVPVNSDWYIAASNEIYLNLPPAHGAKFFDQNRAFAGIGRTIARATRLEVGYLQQTLLQRNARVLEFNHTAQVTIFSNLPFRR